MPEPNDKTRNDEVDLLDLFGRLARWIGNLFRGAGRMIMVAFIFLIRNSLPLLISILAGIGMAFLSKAILPSTYKGDFILRTNSITPADLIRFTDKLGLFCDQDNYKALASSLSIPLESAKMIQKIGAYWIVDKNRDQVPDYVDYKNKFNVYDTLDTRMQDRIDIQIKTRTPGLFLPVRNGIIRNINTDSLFIRLNNVRIEQNRDLITRLGYDIRQLDSLQKVKYFEETRKNIPKTGGQIVFLQEQKTQLVYSDIYSLYQKKQTLESQQILYQDVVTLLSDIPPSIKQFNGGLYYSVIFVPVFFFLTIIILILLRNKESVKELFRKY